MEQAGFYDDVADGIEVQLRMLTEALREHRRHAGRYRAGAAGEQAVAARVEQVIVDLGSTDWHLLADRRWPGTRANLDLLLVGPPGVVVIDSKAWARPQIMQGSLFNGDANEDDQLDGVRDQADAVAQALADVGLAPPAVTPMLVLAKGHLSAVELRGVTVVGERLLHRSLVRLGARLDADAVRQLTEALDACCPPRTEHRRDRSASPQHEPAVPDSQPVPLFDQEALWAEARLVAERGPIESWMTWLHPLQAQLVTRPMNGPARIRGVAGSGKTVVALHRAARASRAPGARVLVTTFVRNLPEVQKALFERLSPSTAANVEFSNLHRWARRLLIERGEQPDLGSDGAAGSAFNQAFASSGAARDLLALGLDQSYWQDEIAHVIKGRGITEVQDYLSLDRVGRRTPLRDNHRQLVWTLFERYQANLAEAGIIDYDDLISAALRSVREQPLADPYTAVIVDEAQDLSCEGMRLLHAIVGDALDGLLVVGDGQQSVYPGGYTLKEAGITVAGRSTVLTSNYRNGSDILRAAMELMGDDDFSDLDVEGDSGARPYDAIRDGGVVRRFPAVDRRSQNDELLADLRIQLDQGARPGDIAVLTKSIAAADRWRQAISAAGIPAMDLARYDGRPTSSVKVGTYQRAKGLEFTQVYIPDFESAVTSPHGQQTTETLRERNELERRCLFVAMTRARDRLWLGTVAAP